MYVCKEIYATPLSLTLKEALLQSSGTTLIDTPYTFKGSVADSWLMEEPLPPATMLPNSKAVYDITQNPSQLQVRKPVVGAF